MLEGTVRGRRLQCLMEASAQHRLWGGLHPRRLQGVWR